MPFITVALNLFSSCCTAALSRVAFAFKYALCLRYTLRAAAAVTKLNKLEWQKSQRGFRAANITDIYSCNLRCCARKSQRKAEQRTGVVKPLSYEAITSELVLLDLNQREDIADNKSNCNDGITYC